MDWQEISGNWVLIPNRPTGIIHFLGGAFIATAPHVTYRLLLEKLAAQRYAVIATPFVNTLDHIAIARDVLNRFETTLNRLQVTNVLRKRYLPIYGIGHSMGCKLHLLIGSLFSVERAGNILISYNNYSADRAIPFVEQLNLNPIFQVEFTPSPQETNYLITQRYQIQRNLLIKFTDDEIDQSVSLTQTLQKRFPNMVALQRIPGNHLTPLGQDVTLNPGAVFTPLDAVGQWVKQEVYRDLNRLQREILRWLNPLAVA
ncbi:MULTISPECIES: DUF1350 family protein [Moorena]|uniref:DUF1350 domain-containing protein n=1 Tax=Moorena producens 3L TaxID=489825 RepID=F4Y0M7_9CYAN|nr:MULTISPECIES: DUF1350 family protein [Moorena]NEQ14343.1 DUF1350 domain-containing protein [Moorena sp. SIO3E2]EGJ29651.1 protein of unknown function, DUF1350 [Moorena producens 3L]NEP33118.1 DUF1350 domain-containing protein [Moorena sp. SIO3B2]NEP66219.1 DUF1350 domain-containing protein [Moorena sp. SIO3A5]NEQ07248.1 DUF1350 domain-containing protein [Moorena sp. SIO4E2]